MNQEPTDINKALSHLKDFQHVAVATIEGNTPRVRPMTLIYLDKRFWLITDTCSSKVKQIKENPDIEFCLVFEEDDMDCCLRVSGKAAIIQDRESKEKIAYQCDFFHEHWHDADDPNFTLIEIYPEEFLYVTPQEKTKIN